MINDYKTLFIYITFGLIAAIYHWFKKRYVDKTTTNNLIQYIFGDMLSTYKALSAIAIGEYGLLLAHTGDILALSNVIAALGIGYMSDSTLNRSKQ